MHNDWPSLLTSALMLISVILLLASASHDLIARTVPNWMALALALVGLTQRAVAGSIPGGLIAGLTIFILAALCWRRGWLGGGDVKLLGAASMVVPPSNVPAFICAVALAGGILAVMYLTANRLAASPKRLSRTRPSPAAMGLFRRALRAERWRIRRGGPLPYACAIAAGFIVVAF